MQASGRVFIGIAAVVAAILAAAAPARAATVCGEGTYAYAGFVLPSVSRGVSATIAQEGPLNVRAGHVAGWVGVVAPNGGNGWLQVGLSALPGDTTSQIYYEVALPGRAPVYRDVRRFIATGEPHRFAVLELTGRPGWWRVWVDGAAVTEPIRLPHSHDRWTAQVLGESWTGVTSGRCNAYAYGFAHVTLFKSAHRDHAGLNTGATSDPNYSILRRSRSSFLAMSAGSTAA